MSDLKTKDARQDAQSSITLLDSLTQKHLMYKQIYDYTSYEMLPCGQYLQNCYSAFADLSSRMEELMQSSFEQVPKGDKIRVRRAGILLVKTLLNSMYTLNWLASLKIANVKPN